MKYLFSYLLFVFVSHYSSSQTPFHNPTVTISGTTYHCTLQGNRIRVVNQENTVSDGSYTANPNCAKAYDKLPLDYYDTIKQGRYFNYIWFKSLE